MFLISLFVFLIKINYSLKISAIAKKGDDMNLDDKEIETMLKDPAFANIAGDLQKLKNSRAQMEATGKELKTMGVDPITHKKIDAAGKPAIDAGKTSSAVGASKTEKQKEKEKDPLAGLSAKELASLGMPSTGGADLLAGLGNLGAGKDPLAALGVADPLKDLGLGSSGPDLGGLANSNSQHNEKSRGQKHVTESIPKDKFKDFDFITKQQARLLLEILKQPTFFNMLPKEAKNIVKVKMKYK